MQLLTNRQTESHTFETSLDFFLEFVFNVVLNSWSCNVEIDHVL